MAHLLGFNTENDARTFYRNNLHAPLSNVDQQNQPLESLTLPPELFRSGEVTADWTRNAKGDNLVSVKYHKTDTENSTDKMQPLITLSDDTDKVWGEVVMNAGDKLKTKQRVVMAYINNRWEIIGGNCASQ